MRVSFRISSAGEAGDPHKLLIAMSPSGRQLHSVLVIPTGWGGWYRVRRAKKKILRRIEAMTGERCREVDAPWSC